MTNRNQHLDDTTIDELARALAYGRARKAEPALAICNRLISRHPDHPDLLTHCSRLATFLGALEPATNWMTHAVSLTAADEKDWVYLASLHERQNDTASAIRCYQAALRCAPEFVDACAGLAIAYGRMGNYAQAATYLEKCRDLKPDDPQVHFNLGRVYSLRGEVAGAIASYRHAIALKPDFYTAHYNLGLAFLEDNQLAEGLDSLLTAAKGDETGWQALTNLCNVYREMGMLDDAIRCGQTAVKKKPAAHQAWHNLANALREAQQYRKAVKCYDRVIALDPSFADAHLGKGIALKRLGESALAMDHLACALSLCPDSGTALLNMTDIHMMDCDWSAEERYGDRLDLLTRKSLENGKVPEEVPFINMTRHGDPVLNLMVAQAWSREAEQKALAMQVHSAIHVVRDAADARLTIGYLSNNFRDHPTAHLTSSLYKHHDRARFRIVAISYGPDDGSVWRRRIESACDDFVDVSALTDSDAAGAIRRSSVDILVDLVGYMQGGRPLISALKPSPLQIRWLGMPGTTGASHFRFILTDPVVTPPDQQPFYTETFYYLPQGYQINDTWQGLPAARWARPDVGLPQSGFVYSCFSTSYKIEATVFSRWMNLLACQPKSVLWLMAHTDTMKTNLQSEARTRGVSPDRIVFASKIPKAEHMQRLRLADVSLDTFRVSGAATTSDALRSGVPVITLKGRTFASRMAASILTTAGLPELVAESPAEYEQLAFRMSADEQFYQDIKHRLVHSLPDNPLFDTVAFTRFLENAYLEMWANVRNQ